jgi:hypothetical protein
MTGWRKRQILDMAEKSSPSKQDWWKDDDALERFAALVREDERDKWMERAHIMILGEREGCHALRRTLSNPHEHCQVSAHAYDMAIAAYGAAIRARGQA